MGKYIKKKAYRFQDQDEIWFKSFIRLFPKKKKEKKKAPRKLVFNFISPLRLSRLFLLKELKRSLDCKLSDKTSNIQ